MSAFESGQRKIIPAVLIYAFCEGEVLMLHRDGRKPNDFHMGKWNGLGGKLEADEEARQAAYREFAEEAGVQVEAEFFKPLGLLHFPLFKPKKNEDWLVWLYCLDFPRARKSELQYEGLEGQLKWIQASEVLRLNLWEGDKHFLPYVLRKEPVHGTFYYGLDGQLLRWHCQAL